VEKELLLDYERNKGRDWLRNMGASNSLRPQANATFEKAIVYDTDPIRNWPETLFSEGPGLRHENSTIPPAARRLPAVQAE
jgi:hypothetical protein